MLTLRSIIDVLVTVLIGFPICIVFIVFVLPLSFFFYWIENRKVYTKYICKDSSFNRTLCKNIKTKVGNYTPPWWYNLHLGSVIQFGLQPHLIMERQLFTHHDGSCFAVDWFPGVTCKILIIDYLRIN